MKKREVSELKRRLNKEHISISRMAGCYVNAEHEKVCTFNEQFLLLDDEEFFKYLEIAKKVLSGTVGNNLLNLSFPLQEEMEGGKQAKLYAIRESNLLDEELLNEWYDLVIQTYEYVGNYLILLFMDAYDVPMKTSDNLNLGESEEVFRYVLCAVCPVQLSKPGLGYIESEKRIGSRVRDWVVSLPDLGFLFPSFNGRSADIHETLFYTKDTKNPHKEFMEKVLGCPAEPTANENKMAFHTIVREVLGNEDEEETEKKLYVVEQALFSSQEEMQVLYPEEEVEMTLDNEVIEKALDAAKMTEDQKERITRFSNETFGDKKPLVNDVIDKKGVTEGEKIAETMALKEALDEKIREVIKLQKKETEENVEESMISVRVSEEKKSECTLREVDGKRFLMIPVSEDDTVLLNGEEKDV